MSWEYRDPTNLTGSEAVGFNRDPISWMAREIQEARRHDPLVGTVAEITQQRGQSPYGLPFHIMLAYYTLWNLQEVKKEMVKEAANADPLEGHIKL